MIHVELALEPSGFDATVRAPGVLAIAEMIGKTPPVPRTAGRAFAQRKHKAQQPDGTVVDVLVTREEDLPSTEFPTYWTHALSDLMEAYHNICAYCCFRIHEVTGGRSVDHMAPKSQAWDRVYEWDNYRLASARLNSRKRDFGDVLDPFEVENGWFTLELVGFQVIPADSLDSGLYTQVEDTIDRLGLNDFRTRREQDAEDYWAGEISFRVLSEQSPFVAMELQRQGRLLPKDRYELLLNTICNFIATIPGGAKKAEVINATDLLEKDWRKAITKLVARGAVMRTGTGSGTRYRTA